MKTYVVGHKNPDTDSVAAAIGYADLLTQKGKEALPLIASDINKGTKLALSKFGLVKPALAKDVNFSEASVVLVDHNEQGQWAEGLIKEHVIELIDHHRFGDFSSAQPIYVRTQPVGSTSSIVAKMYQENELTPDNAIAGLLLTAILTDTLIFKSPTTTEFDKEMARWLNTMVNVDMYDHAQEIFKAKSDISDMTIPEVVNKDFKEFHFNSKIKVGIAVFETVDASGPLARKDEFIEELTKIKAEKALDYLLFAIVDIVEQVAHFIITGDEEAQLLEQVFGEKAVDGITSLPGVVSRKKQMVPKIEEHFANVGH